MMSMIDPGLSNRDGGVSVAPTGDVVGLARKALESDAMADVGRGAAVGRVDGAAVAAGVCAAVGVLPKAASKKAR